MKLFLISQTENNNYDTYDSAVVCAPDADTARRMTPRLNAKDVMNTDWNDRCWCSSVRHVRATYLGEARDGMPLGAVCSSFNAG